MSEDNVTEFLKELSKISCKYGLYIGSCGCCPGVWLYESKKITRTEGSRVIRESVSGTKGELEWDEEKKYYDIRI